MSYDDDGPFSYPTRDYIGNMGRVDPRWRSIRVPRETKDNYYNHAKGRGIDDHPTYSHLIDDKKFLPLRFKGHLVLYQLMRCRYNTRKCSTLSFN